MIPYLDSYYIFYLLSRNEQGSMESQGKSLLLNVSGLKYIEKYIQVIHLQGRNHHHAYFQIKYVRINVNEENISHVLNTFSGESQENKGINQKFKVTGI